MLIQQTSYDVQPHNSLRRQRDPHSRRGASATTNLRDVNLPITKTVKQLKRQKAEHVTATAIENSQDKSVAVFATEKSEAESGTMTIHEKLQQALEHYVNSISKIQLDGIQRNNTPSGNGSIIIDGTEHVIKNAAEIPGFVFGSTPHEAWALATRTLGEAMSEIHGILWEKRNQAVQTSREITGESFCKRANQEFQAQLEAKWRMIERFQLANRDILEPVYEYIGIQGTVFQLFDRGDLNKEELQALEESDKAKLSGQFSPPQILEALKNFDNSAAHLSILFDSLV